MTAQGATSAIGIGQADAKLVERKLKHHKPCFGQTLEQSKRNGQYWYAAKVGAKNVITLTSKFLSKLPDPKRQGLKWERKVMRITFSRLE